MRCITYSEMCDTRKDHVCLIKTLINFDANVNLQTKNISLTLLILLLAVFGIIAGSLYTISIQSMLSKKIEEEKTIKEEEF